MRPLTSLPSFPVKISQATGMKPAWGLARSVDQPGPSPRHRMDDAMALSQRWNSMSRLNRTRISISIFLLVGIAIMASIPVLVIEGVI